MKLQARSPGVAFALTKRSICLTRPCVPFQEARQLCRRQQLCCVPATGADKYGSDEKVLDVLELLRECEDLDDVIEDNEDEAPVWEHEHKVKAVPFTEEELKEREMLLSQQHQQQQRLQQRAAAGTELFPDPLQAVSDIANAYSAEQGFREMSVQELSVALTAGGLVDLLLDVRSAEEVAAGPSIPTAVNVPLDQLSEAVRGGQLDDYILGSIAVVCASGQRSAQATVRLSKVFGFQNVSNVAGGMAAWQYMQSEMGSGATGGCGCGGGEEVAAQSNTDVEKSQDEAASSEPIVTRNCRFFLLSERGALRSAEVGPVGVDNQTGPFIDP